MDETERIQVLVLQVGIGREADNLTLSNLNCSEILRTAGAHKGLSYQ
jgi:hypothetical protein